MTGSIRISLATIATLGLSLAASSSVCAVMVGEVLPIRPATIGDNAGFGRRLAVDDGMLLIGAPQDSDVGPGAGAAFLFTPDADGQWQFARKLYALDAEAFDEFGRAVDIDADTIVVGAPEGVVATSADTPLVPVANAGSAYVFDRDEGGPDNWGQVARLAAEDAEFGDDFGRAVAIDEEWIVVGARFEDDFGGFSGSAYVFERPMSGGPWTQAQKLGAGPASANAYFGETVDKDGDVIAVGAPGELFAPANAGAVHVFTASPLGWLETAVLEASTAVAGDRFGAAIAVSDGSIAAGASAGPDNAVFVFDRTPGTFDWVEVGRLTSPCPGPDSDFGRAVALHGDLLVVGAPFDDATSENSGAIYLFDRNLGGDNAWGVVAKISAADGGSLDLFGVSAALTATDLVIGAPGNDIAAVNGGSAYGAGLLATDTDADGVADTVDNCTEIANGPLSGVGESQRDTDGDGFGNACDSDLNNDCAINLADAGLMQAVFFGTDEDADLDGDGVVDFPDLQILFQQFLSLPGPSALASCASPAQDDGGLIIDTTVECRIP